MDWIFICGDGHIKSLGVIRVDRNSILDGLHIRRDGYVHESTKNGKPVVPDGMAKILQKYGYSVKGSGKVQTDGSIEIDFTAGETKPVITYNILPGAKKRVKSEHSFCVKSLPIVKGYTSLENMEEYVESLNDVLSMIRELDRFNIPVVK